MGNGQLVTIVDVPPVSAAQMFGGAMSIDVVNLGGAHASGNPMEQHDLGTMASDVLSMVSQGQLDPLITGVLPFRRTSSKGCVRSPSTRSPASSSSTSTPETAG